MVARTLRKNFEGVNADPIRPVARSTFLRISVSANVNLSRIAASSSDDCNVWPSPFGAPCETSTTSAAATSTKSERGRTALTMKILSTALAVLLLSSDAEAFASPAKIFRSRSLSHGHAKLKMGLDPVTYLRTEWVSAALCTNQTPRAADVCLQLGTEDGRAVTFIPRTIRELITSSAEANGELTLSARRALKQQQERRGAATVTYVDQPADDLRETADESVDVVISLQAAARMLENGLDWRKSIREAARVLKPGGRFLFVEQTELAGESYLEYVKSLMTLDGSVPEDSAKRFPVFEEVGFDDVDLVIQPHIAGVAIKSPEAGMTPEERARKAAIEEQERLAALSIEAYERGIKKRKRKKKVKKEETA